MNRVIPGPGYFPDPTIGRPVSNGYIYVGIVDLDPTVGGNQKQISVLQEDTTTVQVAQPMRTSAGGVPVYNGSEVTILVDGNYSLAVLNSKLVQVDYIPRRADLEGQTQNIDDMLELVGITGQSDGDTADMLGFFVSFPQSEFLGGGRFAWQASLDKSNANGVSVIDPDNIAGFDGTVSTRDAFLAAQGGGVGLGCWVREDQTVLNTSWAGAVFDATPTTDGTDDTLAIQSAIDAAGLSGSLRLQKGIATVTKLTIDSHIHTFGYSNATDSNMAELEGSWLRLKDSAGLTATEAVLHIKHVDTVSTTKRRFALCERFGIFGNRDNNTNGNGLLVTAKSVDIGNVTVLQCATTGIVCADQTGAGNDGANAIMFRNLWVGYNSAYGIDLQRTNYSGDFEINGGHVLWNDDAGIRCNQPNVNFIGVHVWWNLDGVIVDGSKGGLVQFSGTRIYDNAAAGIRLINSVKNVSIGGDLHANGNEVRWASFTPPKTSGDIPQDEQAGIYSDTDATNILVDNVDFGFLNDTGRQYYGLRSIGANAEFSIGTVTADGAGTTQTDRAIVLTQPTFSALHGTRTKSDMSHPGFISKGDILFNGNSIRGIDQSTHRAWDTVPVIANTLTFVSSTIALDEAAPVNVTDMASPVAALELPIIWIRNALGGSTVTFIHDTAKIRNNSGANISLSANEALGYIMIRDGVWQQI